MRPSAVPQTRSPEGSMAKSSGPTTDSVANRSMERRWPAGSAVGPRLPRLRRLPRSPAWLSPSPSTESAAASAAALAAASAAALAAALAAGPASAVATGTRFAGPTSAASATRAARPTRAARVTRVARAAKALRATRARWLRRRRGMEGRAGSFDEARQESPRVELARPTRCGGSHRIFSSVFGGTPDLSRPDSGQVHALSRPETGQVTPAKTVSRSLLTRSLLIPLLTVE